MRGSRLLIVILGAVLVLSSSSAQLHASSAEDVPLRMASESLVVPSYQSSQSDSGSVTATVRQEGGEGTEYQVYQGVMGRPGVDFPVYPGIPPTDFSCKDIKHSGYYADLSTDCQVFHICDGGRKISFLCPNGTIFRQSHLICDWWFRVDCGKSVELYEESAEQLAADQVVYKARSEERERRRKHKLGDDDELYALDEPFDPRSRPSTERDRHNERERHSKKVVDSRMEEKFPSYSRVGKSDKLFNQPAGEIKRGDRLGTQQNGFLTPEATSSTQQSRTTEASFRSRSSQETVNFNSQESRNFNQNPKPSSNGNSGDLQNNFNRNNQEFVNFNNAQESRNFNRNSQENFNAQSPNGSNKNQHNSQFNKNSPSSNFNGNSQERINFNDRNSQNFNTQDPNFNRNAENVNRNPEYTTSFNGQTSNNFNSNGQPSNNFNSNGQPSNNFNSNGQPSNNFNSNGQPSNSFQPSSQGDVSRNPQITTAAPVQPVFVQKSRFPGRNSIKVVSHKESIHEAASGSLVDNLRLSAGSSFTTAATVSTQEPKRRGQFRSFTESRQATTTGKPEVERQHFAETASFASSNRNGRNFKDFSAQNQFSQYEKTTTTPLLIRVTDATKVKRPELKITQSYSTSPVYKATVPLIKPTTPRSVKQNSKKVTVTPDVIFTSPTQRTTDIREVEVEKGRNVTSRIPIENIYFTTLFPEGDATTYSTEKPKTPEVLLSLQELNIHKSLAQEIVNKSFENISRDGLEVPPSAGPSALRSFALYFAGDHSSRRGKNVPYISKDVLIIPITKNFDRSRFEEKKKEVVKQVEEIVQDSAKSTTELYVEKKEPELPNSLTNQTKESYSALFNSTTQPAVMSDRVDEATEPEFGTTAFESYTEAPAKINSELTKNDLQSSQSRGLIDQGNQLNDEFSRVSPDLRELAQVFTKALSAYLDDPEAFRRVLSEIRPTEPSPTREEVTPHPIDYPSATQEEDEVLDFSDVTKATYRRKSSTATIFRETTTEYQTTEIPTTLSNDVENFVLPLSVNGDQNDSRLNIPALDLIAPLESLDESQSSYYTPSPNLVGTTNAIADEINVGFSPHEKLPDIDSNEAVDSYFPVTGSVDDQSRPRYGGFQNNSQSTKYSPYGADLTSTTLAPETTTYWAETTTQAPLYEETVTTFKPRTSLYEKLKLEELKNQTDEEIALAKELNGLAVSPSTNRPNFRGSKSYKGDSPLPLSVDVSNDGRNSIQSVKLGNGEVLERNVNRGNVRARASTTQKPEEYEPNPEEINLELSPPLNTDVPKGFLITYSLESGTSTQATYLPRRPTTTEEPYIETTTQFITTTDRPTTLIEQVETLPPTTFEPTKFTRGTTKYQPTTELPVVTEITSKPRKTPKSLDRLTELQEALMFDSRNITTQQKETARSTVMETMSNMTMTDTTATTLMKMMEMAAKNETYRRLVLLLVNDKSGKNKTVEETRLSLLKALLTPVIGTRSRPPARRTNVRRGKSSAELYGTSLPPTTMRRITTAAPGRTTRVKTTLPRVVKTTPAPSTTERPSTVIGNLGIIRKTIEESKTKDVRINSLDEAILDSDSRAVELLRSLYSLAARWG